MKTLKPKLTSKQYTNKGGLHCPVCESKEIENVTSLTPEGAGILSQGWQCDACGASWTEGYTLTGYTDLALPGTARCQGCQRVWFWKETKAVKHIWERVQPGDTMPVGECPDCGALCMVETVEE